MAGQSKNLLKNFQKRQKIDRLVRRYCREAIRGNKEVIDFTLSRPGGKDQDRRLMEVDERAMVL